MDKKRTGNTTMFEKRRIDLLEQVRYVTSARISDPKQDIASQVAEIANYTDRELPAKYVNVGAFEDTISTLKNWRKRDDGLCKIINLAKSNKIDHVIFYSIFRLGRDPYENLEIAETLKAAGVSMYFISEHVYYGNNMTSADEIIFSLMSSLAKLERERKHRRGVRGYKEFRRANPDKIWGQQPKLRGKKLELFIEMYKATKPLSRKRDRNRQIGKSGLIPAYSYREIAEILKINKATVSRYVARLCKAGVLTARLKREAKSLEKIAHISKKAALHAEMTEVQPKRAKLIEIDGEPVVRETSMYNEDGELHPAYKDETLGAFGKVTKIIKEELDTFEFMTSAA